MKASTESGGSIGDAPDLKVILDSELSNVPASGTNYWGLDFYGKDLGIASPYDLDAFINRSTDQIDITLSFEIPIDRVCLNKCLPGIEFKIGPSWRSIFPKIVITKNIASASIRIEPKSRYGWIIGLWQSKKPRIKARAVTTSSLTPDIVGLPRDPSTATWFTRPTIDITCPGGAGGKYFQGIADSNGLVGEFYKEGYKRFNEEILCDTP